MQAEGRGGELRVGYHVAARIGSWEMRPAEHGWTISARYVHRDLYWLSQRPLTLVLSIGGLEWTWRSVDIRDDGTLRVYSRPEEGVVDATSTVRHT